jgi:methyl-accepting chemotaxis protein
MLQAAELLHAALSVLSHQQQLAEGMQSACQAQATGVTQVQAAAHKLEQLTRDNAGLARETIAQAEVLTGQSRALEAAASVFQGSGQPA